MFSKILNCCLSFVLLSAIVIFSCEHVSSASSQDSSFVFVIDTTGSMESELDSVKRESLRILDAIIKSRGTAITDLIFVPFNDPATGPILRTSDIDKFKKEVLKIRADGGDDCPEMCLTGIKEALNVSSPKSHIFVFTDADPKDVHLLPDILSLIRLKRSQILFFLTGQCDSEFGISSMYEEIAAVSTGQVFELEKMDVSKIMEFIRYSGESQGEMLLVVDVQPKSPGVMDETQTYKCAVDETISELTLSANGKNIILIVTDSKGNDIHQLSNVSSMVDLNSSKVLRITNPQFENLVVNVTSSNPYSLRLEGVSLFGFIYGFSLTDEWTEFMDDFSALPFQDLENYLYVKPTLKGENNSATPADVIPKFCELTSSDGKVMYNITLSQIQNSKDNTYYGSFNPVNMTKEFYLQVKGETKQGSSFQRYISPSLQSDIRAFVVSVPKNQTLYLDRESTVTCHIESTQPYNASWLKNGTELSRELFNRTSDYILKVPQVSLKDEGNYSCLISQSNVTIERWTYVVVSNNSDRLFSNGLPLFALFLFCALSYDFLFC